MKALVLKFTFTTDFLFKGFQVFDEGIITSMVSLVLMNCSKHIWNTKALLDTHRISLQLSEFATT
jgi:hypothetical protein